MKIGFAGDQRKAVGPPNGQLLPNLKRYDWMSRVDENRKLVN